MDIVSRLKKFLIYRNIPVSQFADSCSIPRPTLSQLLNGRNKKVSDEIIAKIHRSFPELNILWLMFGEGEMMANASSTTSDIYNTKQTQQSVNQTDDAAQYPHRSHDNLFDTPPHSDGQIVTTSVLNFADKSDGGIENEHTTNRILDFSKSIDKQSTTPLESSMGSNDALRASDNETDSTINLKSTSRIKEVINIIVYYSDNSFEAFVPKKSNNTTI